MIKVLIVEDELLMRIGIKSIIPWEEHGFTIVGEASNGKEALEAAEKSRPHLVITDIKMPVMDGIEFIRNAAKVLDSCQYVILSCLEEFQYVKEALKLGAADYLIKSDLKPHQLIEVLDRIKGKIQNDDSLRRNGNFNKSVGFLKESLFKELISGLKSEKDFIEELKQLNTRLQPNELSVIKLSIDRFEKVRQKYVEKDEKLLRFSVVNILEEMIPPKWNKEIVVESSREYLLFVNPEPEEVKSGTYKHSLDKLCQKMIEAMKDFMNISLTIGFSSVVSGFIGLKAAYKEADTAVRNRFFLGAGRTICFNDVKTMPERDNHGNVMGREEERQFRIALESLRIDDSMSFIHSICRRIAQNDHLSEHAIRKTYIRLIELIGTHLPEAAPLPEAGKTPYEGILELDTVQELQEYTESYLVDRFKRQTAETDHRSYVDMAIDIIMEFYAEDISLQSVANQINVNPSYLSRVFKQEAGDNFIRFLTKVRIDKAKFYLETKNIKVYEVAEKVGYHNYTYFSKIFKKVVGVSPEEYRCS
ncbi:response regulator [Paenibacillus alkalitolerans]|uniref:response regulator n=1 Tax=Paenibacillus alkalitolerans TaxID=2799335 RepID=UPI0018F5EC17|nr:response regulator [Paenibacillus alkalitolerans]